MLVLVCWYQCVDAGVLVLVWQIARETFVPFGVQARDIGLESWKEDRIQKPIHTHTHTEKSIIQQTEVHSRAPEQG